MARGQASYQVMVMILAAVFIIGILLLGGKWVSSLFDLRRESNLLFFEQDFTADVASLSGQHGSFRLRTYDLPGDIRKVCVADLAHKDDALESISINGEPVMKDSLSSNSEKNVFVFSDSIEMDFSAPQIEVPFYPYFVCKRSIGSIEFGLRGHGGKAVVVSDLISSAEVRDGVPTTLYSPDGLVELMIPPQDPVSVDLVSIEILEPTEDDQQSELYKFEPSGATFNPPAELTIEYFPALVGECPETLTFTYSYDDGTERDFDAVAIHCKSHRATFLIDRI